MASQVAVKNALVKGALVEWERGNSKWGLWEQLRFMAMIVLWVAAWIARALLVFLPQHLPTAGILGVIDSVSKTTGSIFPVSAEDEDGSNRRTVWSGQAGGLAKCAIGRALSQVLELVNDIPASSRKYEFARSLADKMMYDNVEQGGQSLREVNRMALETGFLRTVYMLASSLEGLHRQQQVEAWGWPWKMIKGLPMGAASLSCQFVPVLATLRNRIGSVMQSQCMQMMAPPPCPSAEDSEVAEKLAQELLWMSQRLKENNGLEVAILHWSSAAGLAGQSVCANLRVQRLLVKLSAFLCSGLIASEVEPPSEVTLKLLLLWLPLFCRSTHGIDATMFTSAEKHEAERVLERTIKLLPDAQQELVLALWLNEFVHSSSDWPNLESCYDAWCYATRKLNYAPIEDGYDDDQGGLIIEEEEAASDRDNKIKAIKAIDSSAAKVD
ncbi:uncharacterized protein LOC9647674 [Selaginella moellendorffii]|uniref:uncharacterized protein LOC9647674 n=1 Tax=Selaginella moellendorffii TaxID=88036 RepID=UPI000D1C6505|nr:uncharacterized protein LOC9647674 [Selaginella moellendorffii]|eukprot:XP_024541117.1 uncharacterized protein LOC9647674 [Selaginella moellendorffii]